jgi:hypothetical protein
MAALKKSLGHQPDEKPGKAPREKAAAKKRAAAQAASKPSRKREAVSRNLARGTCIVQRRRISRR